MVNSSFPTEGKICRALLNAIATHRDVTNAQVFYPVPGSARAQERQTIKKLRLFGALELTEPGVTLSVYPKFAAYESIAGTISSTMQNSSIYYPNAPMSSTLGRQNSPNKIIGGIISLIVQLQYQDASTGEVIKLKSETVAINDAAKTIPYGYLVSLTDDKQEITLDDRVSRTVINSELEVEILPGEEVLREWIPILRGVIRDIPVIYPYSVRNPVICSVNYPTSNWLKDNPNLIFHTAYMIVQYDLNEPARLPDYEYPKIQSVRIEGA